MVVMRHNVEGFESFKKLISELESENKKQTIIVQFSGSKNDAGENWCPDCVVAEPVIESVLKEWPSDREDIVFVYVGVGPRDFWKDPQCIFRTDSLTKLKSVPTLIKWGTPQRLEEGHCQKKDMVEMLFHDE